MTCPFGHLLRAKACGSLRVPHEREVVIKKLQSSEAVLASFASTGEARSASIEVPVKTSHTSELIDITQQVRSFVEEARLEEGLAVVSSPHTTCAIIVNESEPGFTADLVRALERIAPIDEHYEHNDAPHDEEDEGPNGYAHVRAAFLSAPSATIPIRDGMLALGRWQRIFFVELDRGRARRFHVTLLGRA